MSKWKKTFLLIALVGTLWGLLILPVSAAGDNCYYIYGTTWDENRNPMFNVKVIISDGTTLNCDPTFTHKVDGNGAVTIRLEKSGYRFKYHFRDKEHASIADDWVPPEGLKIAPVVNSYYGYLQLRGADLSFYAYPAPKYNISGRVTTQDGKGIPGVSIYFSSGVTVPSSPAQATGNITPAVTDDSGYWGKNGLSGSVTVLAAKTGWNFIPPYILVGSASRMVNFVGTKKSTIINVDGSRLDFDQNPETRNNRVLVPLRKIFEALGAKIEWNQATQTITATKGGTTVKLTIGSVNAYVNGVLVKLDQPPIVLNGRTLVPVRFIGEALGAKVEWDGENYTVHIISKERYSSVREAAEAVIEGFKQNDLAKKIALCSQAIELDPKFVIAYYLRAITYIAQQQPEKAMEDLNKTIELDPKFTMAYIDRGGLYFKQKKFDQALTDCERAVQLEPNNYKGYGCRALAYFGLGKTDKGFADLDKSVELEPKLAVNYALRGYFYAATGQKDKAIKDYKKALEIEPGRQEYREALKNLGATGY